jgi:streptogramin lyase
MRTGALVVGIAALTPTASVGCGGTTHSATTKHASVSSIASSGTSASHVPNPFKIVARYSASSLGLRDPRGLAIGPNGNLYITDATDRVTEVSSTGKMLRRWGGRGTRPGQFDFAIQGSGDPTSLAVGIAAGPNGDVYVSDSGNERVEVFSPTGHFIRQFGSSITGASGHFLQPNALVVDPRGNVYVTDDEQNVVEKYSPSGSFLWQVGSGAGSSDPDLSGFLTLASIDRHGLLPIASDSGAIVYLDAQGHKVDAFHTTAYLPHGWAPAT